MQKDSKAYSVVFAIVICLICGVMLAVISMATIDARNTNKRVEKKTNILSAVRYQFADNATNADIERIYSEKIEEIVVSPAGEKVESDAFSLEVKKQKKLPDSERKLPLFVYADDSGEKFYILPLYGKGLWGDIWGYMSLKSNLKDVYGVVFDHESETPGLGAEITTDWFQSQFEGKQAIEDGNVEITVLKGKNNQLNEHTVDGMSGATITGNGVDQMLKEDLEAYQNYFKKLKS